MKLFIMFYKNYLSFWPFFAFLSLVIPLIFAGCSSSYKKSEQREITLKPVSWKEMQQWNHDDHMHAFRAFMKSCEVLNKRDPGNSISKFTELGGKVRYWQEICRSNDAKSVKNSKQAQAFFEKWFNPYKVLKANGSDNGTLTGYCEIQLNGSRKKTRRYKYPIYKVPSNISKLRGKNNFTRASIENGALSKQKLEIVWVDDPARLFFLHVQGSGTINLPDGSKIKVKYADQNGWPYVPITSYLREYGAKNVYSTEDVMKWLKNNPRAAEKIMNKNPSYVFFEELNGPGPIGGHGVVLTPQRSIAVDYKIYPYGVPIWIETELVRSENNLQLSCSKQYDLSPFEIYEAAYKPAKPAKSLTYKSERYHKLFVAQDTGGAIKGPIRGDIFFGGDKGAEKLASGMKKQGRFYILLPKSVIPRQRYVAR